jgi:preprotein translocase SecE subunit
MAQVTRSVAQLAEQRSPKPQVGGSSPSWPANLWRKAKNLWYFFRAARDELRKVGWPTRQETIQITIVVILMVLISSLFLWGVDAIMIWVIQLLTGPRG